MTVRFNTDEEFFNGIQQFVIRGLTFDADHGTLTVKFTGGY
jgi:hypothetical protein